MKEDKLIKDIEELRNRLYEKVGSTEIICSDIMKDDELVDISNQLDQLILKFMENKKNNSI